MTVAHPCLGSRAAVGVNSHTAAPLLFKHRQSMDYGQKLAYIVGSAAYRIEMKQFAACRQIHATVFHRIWIARASCVDAYCIHVYTRQGRIIGGHCRTRCNGRYDGHVVDPRLVTVGRYSRLESGKTLVACTRKALCLELAFLPRIINAGIMADPYYVIFLCHLRSGKC